MDTDAVHAATAAERRALADLLEGLSPQQWARPSLCAGWDVRTVVGHLVGALDPALLPLLVALVRCGGRLHRANDALAREAALHPPAELVRALRERAEERSSPPVTGPRAPLADVLVHTADIARPLRLPHDPPTAHVRPALDLVTTGRPLGFVARGRLRGLRLVATDAGWSWGTGAEVSGRGIDLLVAACGRPAALASLGGPGAAALADRVVAARS